MARSFRFLQTLGAGAFGEVHLAELHTDEDFVQTVAVKWLRAQHSEDPELASRLRDEARLLGLLQHPNIVSVSGLTRIEGRLAILMEPVAGRDLTGAHLPPRATADLIAAVADALDAAWGTIPPGRTEPLRVVHRDIKPSNIMVTSRGLVKVMDFGVARATFATREAQTLSQQYGTARYMAPERWLDGVAEAPSDIFSLGITLIELASGQAVPRPRLSRQGFDADLDAAITPLAPWPGLAALAREMVSFDHEDRPDAAHVRRRATELNLDGEGLREWALRIEPRQGSSDPLTGTVVVEDSNVSGLAPPTATLDTAPSPVALPPPADLQQPWAVGGPQWPTLVFPVLAVLLAGIVGVVIFRPGPNIPQAPITAPSPIAPTEAGPATPPPEPAIPTPEAPTPEPVAPRPAVPRPPPVARPAPPSLEPEPAPVEPSPAPLSMVTVVFNIDPGVSTSVGDLSLRSGRTAIQVPSQQVLSLELTGPDGGFSCSIPIGSVPEIWHLSDAGRCVKTG